MLPCLNETSPLSHSDSSDRLPPMRDFVELAALGSESAPNSGTGMGAKDGGDRHHHHEHHHHHHHHHHRDGVRACSSPGNAIPDLLRAIDRSLSDDDSGAVTATAALNCHEDEEDLLDVDVVVRDGKGERLTPSPGRDDGGIGGGIKSTKKHMEFLMHDHDLYYAREVNGNNDDDGGGSGDRNASPCGTDDVRDRFGKQWGQRPVTAPRSRSATDARGGESREDYSPNIKDDEKEEDRKILARQCGPTLQPRPKLPLCLRRDDAERQDMPFAFGGEGGDDGDDDDDDRLAVVAKTDKAAAATVEGVVPQKQNELNAPRTPAAKIIGTVLGDFGTAFEAIHPKRDDPGEERKRKRQESVAENEPQDRPEVGRDDVGPTKRTTTAESVLPEPGELGGGQEPLKLLVDVTCSYGSRLETGCRCAKTRCLKLYCDCFQQSKVCNARCQCIECLNTVEESGPNGMRTRTAQEIMRRRPDAFDKRMRDPNSGCKCKHSRCLKKYCECFRLNKHCGNKCNCHGCLNNEDAEREKVAAEAKMYAAVRIMATQHASAGDLSEEARLWRPHPPPPPPIARGGDDGSAAGSVTGSVQSGRQDRLPPPLFPLHGAAHSNGDDGAAEAAAAAGGARTTTGFPVQQHPTNFPSLCFGGGGDGAAWGGGTTFSGPTPPLPLIPSAWTFARACSASSSMTETASFPYADHQRHRPAHAFAVNDEGREVQQQQPSAGALHYYPAASSYHHHHHHHCQQQQQQQYRQNCEAGWWTHDDDYDDRHDRYCSFNHNRLLPSLPPPSHVAAAAHCSAMANPATATATASASSSSSVSGGGYCSNGYAQNDAAPTAAAAAATTNVEKCPPDCGPAHVTFEEDEEEREVTAFQV